MDELTRYVEELRPHMPELAARYGVKSMGVFGSYVHGEQRRGSDLDVLVEFYEPPSLLRFIELEHYLSDLLKVKVDLVMREVLKPTIGQHILREVVTV
jgi:hypothetical protein